MSDYALRPKPWILSLVTRPYQWITLRRTIYHPPSVDPVKWGSVIEHERVHVRQQARDGFCRFVWRYLTSRRWRLDYEAEAIAAEVMASAEPARVGLLDWYAQALAGRVYRRAADSPMAALAAITRWTNGG